MRARDEERSEIGEWERERGRERERERVEGIESALKRCEMSDGGGGIDMERKREGKTARGREREREGKTSRRR